MYGTREQVHGLCVSLLLLLPSPHPLPYFAPLNPAAPCVCFSATRSLWGRRHHISKASIERGEPSGMAGRPGSAVGRLGSPGPAPKPEWRCRSSSPGTSASWHVPSSLTAPPRGCAGPADRSLPFTGPVVTLLPCPQGPHGELPPGPLTTPAAPALS